MNFEQQEKDMAQQFQIGDRVRKIKGSEWQGKIVGTYSTDLTPEGYCVESESHKGSVQIYPTSALELVAKQ
jgi:dihydrofolate reductase (trimethoprim resistance protein)